MILVDVLTSKDFTNSNKKKNKEKSSDKRKVLPSAINNVNINQYTLHNAFSSFLNSYPLLLCFYIGNLTRRRDGIKVSNLFSPLASQFHSIVTNDHFQSKYYITIRCCLRVKWTLQNISSIFNQCKGVLTFSKWYSFCFSFRYADGWFVCVCVCPEVMEG